MKNTHPKKFAVIGLPGSGKSTFAAKLGRTLGIPVHHLDRHMFEPCGKKKDIQEFIEIQKTILDEETWIVEGCSFKLILYFRNAHNSNVCFLLNIILLPLLLRCLKSRPREIKRFHQDRYVFFLKHP